MQIQAIVEFDKKRYFGGAIQANWFYDNEKVMPIIDSYVFHGPKYHGVSEGEQSDSRYRLYDTASYALELFKKTQETASNRFLLTIAGYGTGKSHLAVVLATLISGYNNDLRQAVIERIRNADKDIAKIIEEYNEKNLVIVLNGMNNFNLDHEIMTVVKKALKQQKIPSDCLNDLTQQYKQAQEFVKNTFDMLYSKYEKYMSKYAAGCECSQNYIIQNLDNNENIFKAVDEVYKEINGNYIHWDRGISVGDILAALNKSLCVEKKIVNKIIIMFDEFGRYIEYTATNPQIAGDSSLQQMFEAIQNADGNIIFDGFIQSDLNAYLNRIDKTANIIRYVGRYEASDKYYLSSNFETILANLITKKDEVAFSDIVEYNIDILYEGYHSMVYSRLMSWVKSVSCRSVWTNQILYNSVIVKGCYPIHPIAVWFLSNTSAWMQQRSTIVFVEQMFNKIKSNEINSRWIDYIYATDIIDSDLFNEMLNSEEKGLVQSQYCMLYNDIMLKNGDNFTDNEKKALKAILIISICKFNIADKSDYITAIKYCSGMKEVDVIVAVQQLQDTYGVILFDAQTKRYDLLAEAVGINEFKRKFMKQHFLSLKYNGVVEQDEELISSMDLDNVVQTAFATENNINSPEWCFEKRIILAKDFNVAYCKNLIRYFNDAVDGETPRGVLLYIYFGKNADKDMQTVMSLYNIYCFKNLPLIIYVMNDKSEELLQLLTYCDALRSFNSRDKDIYAKFISVYKRQYSVKVANKIRDLLSEKIILAETGVAKFDIRIRDVCMNKFKKLYNHTVPFMFDGFEKKITPQPRKIYAELCNNIYSGSITNPQIYQSFSPQLKNRIQAVLSISSVGSWQVFGRNYHFSAPKNDTLKEIFDNVTASLYPGTAVSIQKLFSKFLYAPYGMNKYSLALFIFYYISFNRQTLQILKENIIVKKDEFYQTVLQNDKKIYDNIIKYSIMIIQKSNDDTIVKLCSTINNNTDIANCFEYKKQLDELIESVDDISLHKEKITISEFYLKQGLNLYKKLYDEQLIPCEKLFDEVKDKFALAKVTAILSKLKTLNIGQHIDDSNYEYSQDYCNRVNRLIEKSTILLKKEFTVFIKNLNCDISQVSSFKATYLKVAKQLSGLGYNTYSEMLKQRVESVAQKIQTHNKYAQTFAEIDKELSFTSGVSKLDYSALLIKLDKMEVWSKYFKSIDDLDKETIDFYIGKINVEIVDLENRVYEIDSTIDKFLLDILSNNLSIDDIYKKVVILFKSGGSEDRIQKLLEIKLLIEKYQALIKNINETFDCYQKLQKEYTNDWKNTICAKDLKGRIDKLKLKLEQKRTDWMQANISNIEMKSLAMTASACIKWQKNCNILPDYLNEEDIEEIHYAEHIVADRLKSLKIQGIVEMFNELSKSEKIECLRLLNENNFDSGSIN